MLSVVAIYCLSFATTLADAQDVVYLQLDNTPLDMQVSPWDGSIIVSAGLEMHRLNPDFTLNSSVITHDRRPARRIAVSSNASHIVLACKETYCTLYDVDWMYQMFYHNKLVGRGFYSVPLSIDPQGFYIGTSDSNSIDIIHFNEDFTSNRNYERSFNNNSFYQRQFLQGFQYNNFVYFIVRDNGTNEISNNVRAVRVCHELHYNILFDAAYEAVLDCGVMSASSKVEVGSNLMDEFGNATITLAVTTDDETSICSFSLEAINSEMDKSYTLCSSGRNNSLVIPLAWYSERTCSTFTLVRDMCNFGLENNVRAIPALATFKSVPGQHLLRFNESEEITAVLAFKVGKNIDLLFVAYTTPSEDNFLDKYHITSDGALELVLREQHNLPVILLRWNEAMEEIYGANTDSVFGIPLERCSNYSTCGECTSSRDPLCGWCALDQYCSRDAHCTRSSDEGRWVNRQELCIISVSLATNSMDVDLIKSVELTINPQDAILPSSGYQCSFYHENHENVSYGFTTPFTGGACQLQQAEIADFAGKHINLSFALHIPNHHPLEIFPSSSVLVLHNCSLHSECGECVDVSMSCGWCVHDRICTGNPSTCRHEDDWRSLADVQGDVGSLADICPLVVTPDHGSYTLSVAVERELVLSTRNVPTEIPGYQYGCQMKYRSGTVLQLEPGYHNETEFRCFTSENQVHLSSDVTNGTEASELELLWTRSTDNYTVTLHTVKVTLYDCTQLGSECSSCLSANLGTGFECIWCDREEFEDVCTVIDHCKTESTVSRHISTCPLPIITSISPKSGPTAGGTVLTVNGRNLGAMANDVIVELVKSSTQERIQCIVDETKYIPGVQIVCTTQDASEGDHSVTVNVTRGNTIAGPRPLSLEHTFTYAHPIVNSVEPLQGPKAGGTEITILGSNLDISSPGVVKVFIGDIQCDIQSVSSTVIVCVSRPVAAASALLRIRVHIDNADRPSEKYNYTENPSFTTVEPKNIIPAGGVTLSFKGTHLDVVLNPELIMRIDSYTLKSACKPKSSSLLKCTSPKLPTDISLDFELRKNTRNAVNSINYTILLDGADGPVPSTKNLQLTVKPNPVFSMLHVNDREYTLESERTIRILGRNIDSVIPSELSVLIDEATCTVIADDISATQIRCYPPDTVAPGDRYVKVFVGESGLNYSVGFLRYSEAKSSGSNTDLLLIIIPALAGMIVLMLTVLAIFCCSVGVLLRRKRRNKAKQRALFNEDDKSQVPVMLNMYNHGRLQAREPDYDTIPDVLAHVQLERMEMMTCAAQEGVCITNISAAVGKSNIYCSEDEGRGSSTGSNNHSRPTSSSTSGSRPHSSSTTGSLSSKPVHQPPLPPLPTSMSDEYVAMLSATDASTTDDTADATQVPCKTKLATVTASVVVYNPATSDEEEKGTEGGYDKLEPKEKTEKIEPDTTIATFPEQQLQESSA